MEFQAEAERERKISGQFSAAKDQVNLRQPRVFQSPVYGLRRRQFVEMHFLLRIELAHHFQQRGNLLVREKLKECIHTAILAELRQA